MKALRLKNLRSLADTGKVELRPITLLVGKNSSGKSTFARVLPLLKQSIEKATDSPILWFEKYVDFGSIAEAMRFDAQDDAVTFGFSLVSQISQRGLAHWLETDVEVALAPRSSGRGTYVRECTIDVHGSRVELRYAEDGHIERFVIDGRDMFAVPGLLQEVRVNSAAYIIPSFEITRNGALSREISYEPYFPRPFKAPASKPFRVHVLDRVATVIRPLAHGNMSHDTLFQLASELRIAPCESMLEQLRSLSGGPHFAERTKALTDRDWTVQTAHVLVIASQVPYILSAADEAVADFVSRTAYMGPQRVMAERYHRVRDLAVEEVDFRGENLAMFLRSLSDAELASFARFTSTYFNFEVGRRIDGAHVEILIRTVDGDRDVNLVDVGFGYSQLLPLLALLWSSCARERTGREQVTSLVVLEQPELHLHPGHQARIADLLVGAVREGRASGKGTRLLVETHSEALVNRLGDLIEDGKIEAPDIQIAIFEHDAGEGATKVRFARYDKGGALVDWPFGFFAPIPG
jgi:predicted ATPase